MDDKRYLYEEMPVGRAVISLAVPTVISQLITVIYNMADTFFVGQLNDPAQVAAATISMPPFILLTGIANLFGIGGASLISRSLGSGDRGKAERVSAFSTLAAAVTALIYGLLFVIFKPMLLPILGAKQSTYGFCYSYMFWTVTIGAVPTVMNICLAHLVRSEGMSKQAAFGVAMGGILNIILDPIFIFVFGLEITGAAMATCLSNITATLYFVLILKRRKDTVINARPANFTLKDGIPKEVCMVGLPNCVMNLMGILSNVVLNNIMAGHSDTAIAGIGIAKKIDMLTLAVASGMTQGVLSLIAYNYASGNYKRMLKSIRTVFAYTMGLAILTTLFLFFCAVPVTRFFIGDPETVMYGQKFLRIICIICPMQAVTMTVITSLQAMGQKKKPLIMSLMRKGTVDTPIMLFMNAFVGVIGVAWATPIAELATCIAGIVIFMPVYRRLVELGRGQDMRL